MNIIPYILLAIGLISMVFCRIAVVRQVKLNISDKSLLTKINIWKISTYLVLGLSILSALYFEV